MLNPTPAVDCRFGAPMGRYTGPDYLEAQAGKMRLLRIRLDSGGYDPGGAYWGIGQRLYYCEDGDGNSRFFRAFDRAAAKRKILADFPDATFFR